MKVRRFGISLRDQLENLYRKFNRKKYIHPDPLEFVHRYQDPRDQEVAGFIAAALAFGQVGQILKDVERALSVLHPSPHTGLLEIDPRAMRKALAGFKHRWATGEELVSLLMNMQRVCRRYGSLRECFLAGFRTDHENVLPALTHFVAELQSPDGPVNSLLSSPARGSACKRLHLFLRWMVRCDDVDPGGWDPVSPAQLIVPLDTHIYRIGKELKFTRRKQANLKTALEITDAFRRIVPEDPVRYDFALSRMGMRGEEHELCQLKVASDRAGTSRSTRHSTLLR